MEVTNTVITKSHQFSPDQVAQLVRESSLYARVVGLVHGQGTYKNQPMNA